LGALVLTLVHCWCCRCYLLLK